MAIRSLSLVPLLALVALTSACGGGDDAGGAIDAGVEFDAAPSAELPETLHVTGEAAGTEEGTERRVECSFFADVGDLEEDGDGGWTGIVFAGEIFRRGFDDDAPLFEFQALVGGPASLAVADSGVELRVFGEQPDDAVRFWLALEVLEGEAGGANQWSGELTCAPVLDADDALDDPQIDAAGTWSIEPLET